jgi:hypothetical protein
MGSFTDGGGVRITTDITQAAAARGAGDEAECDGGRRRRTERGGGARRGRRGVGIGRWG